MSRNQLIKQQIIQIKVLLADLRKVKGKCISMADAMRISIPKKLDYQKLQREVQLKASILDYPRILHMKNKLIHALDELFQTQEQLSSKHRQFLQKGNFKFIPAESLQMDINQTLNQQFGTESERSQSQYSVFDQGQNSQHKINSTIKTNQVKQSSINEIKTNTIKAVNKMTKRVSGYQIPTYTIRQESAQNKLDSILKFVASLKRDMKRQTRQFQQSNGRLSSILNPSKPESSWNIEQKQNQKYLIQKSDQKIRNILMLQPEYLKVREAYERMQMKYQELTATFNSRIQQQVSKRMNQILQKESTLFFNNNGKCKEQEQKNQYDSDIHLAEQSVLKEVTNFKQCPSISKEGSVLQKEKKNENRSDRKTSKEIQNKMVQQIKVEKKYVQQAFQFIQNEVQHTQERIHALRAKRKQAFEQDDDLWNQIESIQ